MPENEEMNREREEGENGVTAYHMVYAIITVSYFCLSNEKKIIGLLLLPCVEILLLQLLNHQQLMAP